MRHLTDAFALVEDPEVEAVLVASPDETHADLVLACLRKMKPVLCEKPLASTPEDCLRLVAAEVECDKRLIQVGFMRRFDPAYGELRDAVATKRMGRALLLHCQHRNAKAPGFFTPEMSITNAAGARIRHHPLAAGRRDHGGDGAEVGGQGRRQASGTR